VTFGQRFARFTTDVVVRWPFLWRVFRRLTRAEFDRLAPVWDGMRRPDMLAPMEAALDRIEPKPQRVLDVGTGTGAVARLAAERFPDAEVVGADLSERMIAEARRLSDSTRVRYEVADAGRLPFEDASFDLATLGNMIPFFDELARVIASGGHVVIAYSGGSGTPIYVPTDRLRAELGRRKFSEFAEVSAGRGTALVARRD